MIIVKRIYRLQKIKIEFMLDTIQALSDIILEHYQEIPNEALSKMTTVLNNFLVTNERIDNARQRNISNFYNKLRNNYEGLYNMEVQNEEEKEKD